MFEGSLNVEFRSTCNTYMEIWETKSNEFIDKVKDLFSRGWDAGRDGTLIECIQNDVSGIISKDMEHFFKTFRHSAIFRSFFSTIVCRVKSEEHITTRIGPNGKLEEEGR